MAKYRLGIFTSFHDDYAVDLLDSIDQAIEKGTIDAHIPFVFCNKEEGESEKVDRRMAKIRSLENMGELILFSPANFEKKYRFRYDRQVLTLLPKVDSCLSLGYMQIITYKLFEQVDIVNIHPAIPKIGPVGMWPEVMEEQAERVLPYLVNLDLQNLKSRIQALMNISWLRAGGMLHIVTGKMDRGPVISWYEFPLTGENIDQLWQAIATRLRSTTPLSLRKQPIWERLVEQIRSLQFAGEKPLILITYRYLTKHDWTIRDKTLYIEDEEYPYGYCLNQEVREYLKERGKINPIP